MLEQRLEREIKAAMLAHDSVTVTTLRGLKAVLLSAKIASGTRDQTMPDAQIIDIFVKEAKKRQESAVLYKQGGNQAKANAELTEKALIESYLPAKLSDAELTKLIDESVAELKATDMKSMGAVIADVKIKAAGAADGALIAQIVKQRLSL